MRSWHVRCKTCREIPSFHLGTHVWVTLTIRTWTQSEKKNKTSRFLRDSLIGHLNVKENPRSQWLNGLLVRKKRREFSGMMIHGSSLVINNHPISTPSNPSDPSSNPTFSTSKIVHGCFLGINHYYPWLTIINHHESPIRIINYRYIKSH